MFLKKFSALMLCAAMGMSASAISIQDLTGLYELQNPYGSIYYIIWPGYTTYGITEDDSKDNAIYINQIKVTTDGEYLYFSNFLTTTFYAEVDLEAMTVTVPVQDVTGDSGYSFTLCHYSPTMFKQGDETAPSFKDDDAQPIVFNITEDGDLVFADTDGDEATTDTDYLAYWGWGANYGYINGTFHKTSPFVPDEQVKEFIGTHTCTEFKGEWCSIWGEWNSDWYKFDINTGEGIDRIQVEKGPFDVSIESTNGLEVQFNGLWWGALSVPAYYEQREREFVIPVQYVWGGYTLCNSSICDLEVITNDDIRPATAVVNDDGSITMHYTVEYNLEPYLYCTQVLDGPVGGLNTLVYDTVDAEPEYYNLQGMKVAQPTAGGCYIVRRGDSVSKQIVR